MNKILRASIPALALTLALGGAALAADTTAKTAPQAQTPCPYGYTPGSGMGQGHGFGRMAGLTPEKQEKAAAIMQEHREKVFPLRQDLYAANVELESLLSKGDADPAKVKAADEKIAAVQAKIAEEYASFRQNLYKETGLRQAPHGMGMGRGMGMMGEGGCPMMGGGMGMMGGKGHGKGMGMGMGKGMGYGPGMGQQAPAKTKAPKTPATDAQ